MKLIIISVFLFASTLQAQSEFRFFLNNINLPINNYGILADVNIPPEGTLGRYLNSSFLFSGGFWLSGYNADTLWANGVASASLIENYQPGNVGSNQYDPRYKIYVVKESDQHFGNSWQEWIFAVEIGAEFYDGDNDGIYNPVDLNGNGKWDFNEDRPDIIGDQVAWCVFNDGVTPRIRFENVPPIGIEIQQTVFGYTTYNAPQLENILFIRYKIINKGTVNPELDSVYFAAWADPDIGYYYDDLISSDSLLESCIIYNDSSDISNYGDNPPAFLIPIIQGPVNYKPGETFIDNNLNGIYDPGIDTALDTAYNHKGHLGIEIFPGAKNLGMTSFNSYYRYEHITGIFRNKYQVRNHQKGLYITGDPVDPCAYPPGTVLGGVNCNEVDPFFWFSGDPLTQTGWIDTLSNDYRIAVNTGPFILKENEPITLIIAYIAGRDTSSIISISAAKNILNNVTEFYKNNFGEDPVSVEDENTIAVNDFKLFQNYPNPFNPVTKIKYSIPSVASSFSLSVTLKVYDVLGNEITTLVNEKKPSGEYEVEFEARNFPSGVYFYQLNAGEFIQTKKMLLIK